MKRQFSASVSKENDWYIAQCLEVDVASQGESEAAALENLREALELHFETPRATEFPEVKKVDADIDGLNSTEQPRQLLQ